VKDKRLALRGHQFGGLLIEVLVSLVICAFALLGMAGMQSRAATADFEASQRGEAILLVEDMVNRMAANRARMSDYAIAGLIGAGALQDCAGLTGAARDVCEWGNLLRGRSEIRGGQRIGAMTDARGCITRQAGTTDRFIVAVAWQGSARSAASAGLCGQGDPLFSDDALRRTVSSTVCAAGLRDSAASAPALRC
jgi:type IV pilus assembly protein PilV